MHSLLTATLTFALVVPAIAQEENKRSSEKKKGILDEEVKKSTEKGLEWLARQQNNDGSWGTSTYPHNTAITSFAMLAFMSQGHVPNQGKYGPEVAKGARYLLASSRDGDGYLSGRGGNMYAHGMATLALSQLWGMTGDEDVRKMLKKATELTIRTQHDSGGWRYDPAPTGHDISVTIMQVMALRGAKDSGLNVPEKTMKKALEYINSCYDSYSGGYTYQPHNRQPGFARTAAGVCVIKLTGEYDKNIDRSIKYMKEYMENPREHYWYGHYYACHAFHQIGEKEWENYYSMIKSRFLKMQSSDGSWSVRNDYGSAGPVYQTAIAIIALSVPANYLPIFQR